MSNQFQPEVIKASLAPLSRRHSAVFAATCCERLLPHYRVFVDTVSWGDFVLLRSALDLVWRFAVGDSIPDDELKELVKQCSTVVPDTEMFGSLLGSEALDASVAICEALDLCIDGDVKHAVNAASCARDTVDMYIQERDNMDYADHEFEKTILTDPLMVRELHAQDEVLAAVRSQGPLDVPFVTSLQLRFRDKSNIW